MGRWLEACGSAAVLAARDAPWPRLPPEKASPGPAWSGSAAKFSFGSRTPRCSANAHLLYAIGSLAMTNSILQVENLVKKYDKVEAVRGVSFAVEEGEVFGLLGPNGAGKTTTVEILEGLRTPDGGRVSVCGLDPQRDSQALKREIGAALQATSLPDKIRVMEALRLFASFYKRHRNPEELLKRFGLDEKRNPFYNQLSQGPNHRLALAMALVNDPRVCFLDEPTAGLDPQVLREISM